MLLYNVFVCQVQSSLDLFFFSFVSLALPLRVRCWSSIFSGEYFNVHHFSNEMSLDGMYSGMKVRLVLLWCWVESMWLDHTSSPSTLMVALINCLTFQWVRPKVWECMTLHCATSHTASEHNSLMHRLFRCKGYYTCFKNRVLHRAKRGNLLPPLDSCLLPFKFVQYIEAVHIHVRVNLFTKPWLRWVSW